MSERVHQPECLTVANEVRAWIARRDASGWPNPQARHWAELVVLALGGCARERRGEVYSANRLLNEYQLRLARALSGEDVPSEPVMIEPIGPVRRAG